MSPPQGHVPGETVAVTCRPGYIPEGDMTSLCQNNRTWATPSGACVRLSCGPPPVEDATSVKVLGRSQLYGERVMFMCRPGLSPTRNPTCPHLYREWRMGRCSCLCSDVQVPVSEWRQVRVPEQMQVHAGIRGDSVPSPYVPAFVFV
ncbi:hypothetical protein C0Q70_16185 [Pomacea canaliculata]|uniref:Sushi domain-containing protein n=1 Tax=Pomacea canaliculata TaxID=400727 RepID=A0A2T7NP24_POMCA|nr:hypothetical protein C0Q70_16185 [Pomacea canaliculata]